MKTETDKNSIVAGIRGAQAARAGFCAALAAVMLAAGCAKEPLPDAGGAPDGGGVAVTLNLTPEALSMPVAEDAAAAVSGGVALSAGPATAASGVIAADGGGVMSLQLLAQSGAPETRATAAELTVDNAWILQFDGTANTSKLIRKSYLTVYAPGMEVSLLPGASQRIVVLANSYDPALCDGLLLHGATYADVQAMAGPAPDALNANACIPMSGTATLTVDGSASLAVTLKSIVAKVTFQVKVGRGMPTTGWEIQPLDLAPAYWLADTGATPYPAAEKLTGDASAAMTGVTLPVSDYATYTWYLPVNRRGSVSGTTAAQRRTNAPAGATYIKLSHEATAGNILTRRYYYIHLGANFTTDYNLQSHTHYSYLTTLQAVAGDDSRAEVKEVDTSILQYAGMFGGQLVEKNGVWQFTKELWVTKVHQTSKINWSTETVSTGATDFVDGKGNTLLLAQAGLDKYPSAAACWNLNTGLDPATTTVGDAAYQFFLPAQKQLAAVWLVLSTFDSGLQFGIYHWSSTEYDSSDTWTIYMGEGFMEMLNKKTTGSITRCVREL